MRRLLSFLPLILLALPFSGCNGQRDTPTSPGRGSLSIVVKPNPILATRVTGTDRTYDFPFEVVATETGGQTVTLSKLTVDVKALGIPVFTKSYDATYLRDHNFSPVIQPGSTVHYSFTPRADTPDAAFSSNVKADVQLEGLDDKGNTVRQTTTVSIRKA